MNWSHYLNLNPSKTELLDISGIASPCRDLVTSLENSLITPSDTLQNFCALILLTWLSHAYFFFTKSRKSDCQQLIQHPESEKKCPPPTWSHWSNSALYHLHLRSQGRVDWTDYPSQGNMHQGSWLAVQSAESISVFKQRLKCYLFTQHLNLHG